jgi:hypothetical protein
MGVALIVEEIVHFALYRLLYIVVGEEEESGSWYIRRGRVDIFYYPLGKRWRLWRCCRNAQFFLK